MSTKLVILEARTDLCLEFRPGEVKIVGAEGRTASMPDKCWTPHEEIRRRVARPG